MAVACKWGHPMWKELYQRHVMVHMEYNACSMASVLLTDDYCRRLHMRRLGNELEEGTGTRS